MTPWTVAHLCPWILQARILEQVAISFSRGSSQSRAWNYISCLGGGFFTAELPDFINELANLFYFLERCLLNKYYLHIHNFASIDLLYSCLVFAFHKNLLLLFPPCFLWTFTIKVYLVVGEQAGWMVIVGHSLFSSR